MMNVQSIGCQPIKQAYSNQSFGHQTMVEDDPFIDELNNEKDSFDQIRKTSDSKVLATVGTIGAASAAAALQFFTFKAIAPRAYTALSGMAKKCYNLRPIKATFGGIGKMFSSLGRRISGLYNSIKPETKMGKVKTSLDTKVAPFFVGKFEGLKKFAQAHNLNKAFAKKALINTGAVCVSIPAAITTANLSENGGAAND